MREENHGDGFPGWGALQGISIDSHDNPSLCPEHLAKIADFTCSLENKNGHMD